MQQAWRAAAPAVRPDINVTPLVDIVLVLLIICMVVAPRLNQDVPVELPGIFNPDPSVKAAEPLKLTIVQAGQYYINDQPYDLENAMMVLAAEHAGDPLRRLELRADAKLRYGQVREIFLRSQQVGFPGLSLLVSERPIANGSRAMRPADGGGR